MPDRVDWYWPSSAPASATRGLGRVHFKRKKFNIQCRYDTLQLYSTPKPQKDAENSRMHLVGDKGGVARPIIQIWANLGLVGARTL